LEKERGNRFLIVYITSIRQNFDVQMADDCIRLIYEHLKKINKKPEEIKVDLFLCSNGGSGVVPWRLVSLIREFCDSFEILIPYKAYSAATLTALGADKIIMHKMGELGPIDPSIITPFNPDDPKKPGGKLSINIEDVTAYFNLIKEDIKINHEDELIQAVKFLADKIHPLALGTVKRSHFQAEMVAKKLLKLHMKESEEHEINEIVQNLKSKLFFHGHPINRKEGKEDLNLKIDLPTPRIEELMWELYKEYEEEMQLNTPFNPIKIINEEEGSIKKEIQELTIEMNKIKQKMEKESDPKQKEEFKNDLQEKQEKLLMLDQKLGNIVVSSGSIKGAYIESENISHVFVSELKIIKQGPDKIGVQTIRGDWEEEK